jgi:hypothetical protein
MVVWSVFGVVEVFLFSSLGFFKLMSLLVKVNPLDILVFFFNLLKPIKKGFSDRLKKRQDIEALL